MINRHRNIVLLLLLTLTLSSCFPGKILGSTATLKATILLTGANTPKSSPTLGIGSTEISPIDGMVQDYVEAGTFLMGSLDSDSTATSDEKPQHAINLNAYWIDQTEVTNAMYAKCVQAGICQLPLSIKSRTHDSYYGDVIYTEFPVIWVNWDDAKAYCQWAGRRLPTEAEWEKAARGTDDRVYPWGNLSPTCALGNFGLKDGNCVGDTSKVGSYPRGVSPYGALDMVGNVWEFVSDWYDESYYSTSPSQNPLGPDSGSAHVIRGGSWYFDTPRVSAVNRAWYVGPGGDNLGFRCDQSK
jgi:formylglycine-generating enzyme required for sulfatase activity